jgi:signal peptidase I
MIARRVGRVFSALLIAAGILFGALLIAPGVMGWERYVIVSGSMTGTYDRGSLVFDELIPTKSLKVGDVITYKPPPGAGPKGLVTHRLIKISHDKRTGEAFYRTKGDANATKDPWTFVLSEKEQPRVVASIPDVGFVLAALAQREVRMLIVGLPALLIALFVMVGLWRDAGREARDAAEAQAAAAGASAA